MKTLAIYKNGNYIVALYDNGTKIRQTIDDNATEFIADFPENMDVKITNKCSQNCPFCYEGCYSEGKHAILFNEDGTPAYEWMNHVHKGTELAINGNDLDHPQLIDFLKFFKTKGVFVNITVNQKQFEDNYSKLFTWTNIGLIQGLGISLKKYTADFYECCKWFPNLVVHTIVGVTPISEFKKLEYKNYKVLMLGFKRKGRGIAYDEYLDPLGNIDSYKKYLQEANKDKHKFNVLSFDNLALEQLDVKNTLNISDDEYSELYQGDDGTHTFYMDLVNGTYSKSSIVKEMHDIGNLTCDEMLYNIRTNNF